jgi:hypothetical protein
LEQQRRAELELEKLQRTIAKPEPFHFEIRPAPPEADGKS